ncbi:MAG: biotin/lipoyl-containing protein, partial [Gemmatimonadaceae bacterium]
MTSIKVPPLGESIVEAIVSRWLKNEGDAVAPGDTLVELETDKITVEVPSVTGGVLTKRHAKEGDVVKLDQLLADVDEKAEGGAAAPAAPAPPAPAAKERAQPSAPAAASGGGAPGKVEKVSPRASPAAQRTAAERGADLSGVQGTGRGGVISKADVLDAKPAAKPSTPA